MPDARTIWLYREGQAWSRRCLGSSTATWRGRAVSRGARARGQILDAPILPVPRQHNTREENKAIKAGDEPEGWADKPAKRSQKDTDARWSEEGRKTVRGTVFPTSKYGKSHYGDKNHVNLDRRHKLIRRYHVSDAALHDGQAVDQLPMRGNTGRGAGQTRPGAPRRWRRSCVPGSCKATSTARANAASR